MNESFDFLKSIGNVSEETFKQIREIAKYKKVPSGTKIVELNEIPTKIYMLISGAMRCYLNAESGKEYNKSFYLPISFFASLTALLKRKPSPLVFETLSECIIYELDFHEFMKLSEVNTSIKDLYIKVLELVYVGYEKRLVEMISLPAKERYLQLLKQYPNIEDSISQYHIASYLGITAVQLSRIRKKITMN